MSISPELVVAVMRLKNHCRQYKVGECIECCFYDKKECHCRLFSIPVLWQIGDLVDDRTND